MLPLDHERVERAVEGHVSMARKRGKLWFIREVRAYGIHILSDKFIRRVLVEPQRRRGVPGASLTAKRSRGKVDLPEAGLSLARVPTAMDFPELPLGLGSMVVKSEPQVGVLIPNPISLESHALPLSELGRVKVEPEKETDVSVSVGSEVEYCSEREVIIISDSEEMEVETVEKVGFSWPVVEEREVGFSWSVIEEGKVGIHRPEVEVEGPVCMDRSERRSRRTEEEGCLETRDRSRSRHDEGRGEKRVRECPLCGLNTGSVRLHVMSRHLPPVFGQEAWEDPRLDRVRFRGVICLIGGLGLQSIDEAMLFVHRVKLAIPERSWLYDGDQAWLERVCRRFLWSIPSVFHVARVHSRAVLFHWRVMAALLKLCGPEFRDNFVAQKFSRRRVVPATESAQAAELTQRPGPSSTVSMEVQATGSTQGAESIQELEPVHEVFRVTGSAQKTELAQRPRSSCSVVIDARLIDSNIQETNLNNESVHEPGPVHLMLSETRVTESNSNVGLTGVTSGVMGGAQDVSETQVAGSVTEKGSVECGELEDAPVVLEWVFAINVELTAFDSHFHLDRSCKVTRSGSLEALVGHSIGPMPEVRVRVTGGIAN
ncbi:hypothetical protein DPMN_155074 [Dreissena polymorpha]|uniref:Uncharacterized protein n=1 Tax=Dreissena polymorpha TaxID=45954 RepID=A0A9D4J9P6_DREPO|nr:hypothetical protein DPMN_155074 [Dreissena polymorpha]